MLRRLFQFRDGEAGRALRLFAYLFLVVCSYVITKTTRDALFLERFPAARLPWADIATAFAITFVMAAYLRVSRLATLPVLLNVSLLVTIAISIGFWAIVRGDGWKASSSGFETGAGLSGKVTRLTGAIRSANPLSAATAATSAAKP